jgi:hypothetical protein
LQLERWLNQMQRERRWSDVTWNKYHQLLHALFVRAIKWRTGNVSRMSQNSMDAIERRVAPKRRFRVRIEENAEDRLFAACDLIDQPCIGRRVLDWDRSPSFERERQRGSRRSRSRPTLVSPPRCVAKSSTG